MLSQNKNGGSLRPKLDVATRHTRAASYARAKLVRGYCLAAKFCAPPTGGFKI